MGRKRQKSRNMVKNSPKLPMKTSTSKTVGLKLPQFAGRKSRVRVVTMITKRSNHIPMLTKIEMMKRASGLRRILRNQKNCGEITLQETMIQYAQLIGPRARLINTNCSKGLPLYAAMDKS